MRAPSTVCAVAPGDEQATTVCAFVVYRRPLHSLESYRTSAELCRAPTLHVQSVTSHPTGQLAVGFAPPVLFTLLQPSAAMRGLGTAPLGDWLQRRLRGYAERRG